MAPVTIGSLAVGWVGQLSHGPTVGSLNMSRVPTTLCHCGECLLSDGWEKAGAFLTQAPVRTPQSDPIGMDS